MMTDRLKDRYIRQVAGLLKWSASTDKQDLPTGIPLWYLLLIDHDHDKMRRAAISICDLFKIVDEQQAQLDAVRPYLQHKHHCIRQTNLNYACDCGLQQAIQEKD